MTARRRASRSPCLPLWLLVVATAVACERGPATAGSLASGISDPASEQRSGATNAAPAAPGEPASSRAAEDPDAGPSAPESASPVSFDPERYAWLGHAGYPGPAPVDALVTRLAAPPEFVRVPLEASSFGSWLRTLPLAAEGTPVRTYRGDVLLAPDDPRVAAVVAIDVGTADLQQCADAVVRLHAEWRWSLGQRDHQYRAASGLELPFARFARGERVLSEGNRLFWKPVARPADGHPVFRRYLDTVFAWANTVSIERQAARVAAEALAPGDFFILPGNPGHAVLVLDLAVADGGRRVALRGHVALPEQSVHVLRPRSGATWFELAPDHPVPTPFWRPFPWSSLRRLENG